MKEVLQIEVYEALKGKIGEQEAKLLIEYIEIKKKEVATKEDIMRLEQSTKEDIQRLEEIVKMVEKSTKEDIQRLEKDIQRVEKIVENIENEINELRKEQRRNSLLDFRGSYNFMGNYHRGNYHYTSKNEILKQNSK